MAKPGKPEALGGAAQPSYLKPGTVAGRADALAEAEEEELVDDMVLDVELLVNWAEATAAKPATRAARMKLDETIFDIIFFVWLSE